MFTLNNVPALTTFMVIQQHGIIEFLPRCRGNITVDKEETQEILQSYQ